MSDETQEPVETDEYKIRDNTVYSHMRGGPLDGRVMAVRRPKGVLVVDKVANLAWVYDLNEDRFLICRDESGEQLSYDGRMRAVEECNYDVIAYTQEATA
jgi:hypothetical protein